VRNWPQPADRPGGNDSVAALLFQNSGRVRRSSPLARFPGRLHVGLTREFATQGYQHPLGRWLVDQPAGGLFYSTSKAGLIHLTRRTALTLIKDNAVANCIAPGAFIGHEHGARDDADDFARRIPAGRNGREDDIAAAAIYLARAQATTSLARPLSCTAADRTPSA
jgi:NAD(P)-dependent dehydrogenase (short-subunit alcohol dehydrogenase family)